VQIEQMSTIQEAMKKEQNIIFRSKPKYNEMKRSTSVLFVSFALRSMGSG
jgi:hypothetical protein